MLKIRCPHCKQEFYVDKDLSEQIVECQNCQQKIRVPKMDKALLSNQDIKLNREATEQQIDFETHGTMEQNNFLHSKKIDNLHKKQQGGDECKEHTHNGSFIFICPECGTASELKAGMNGKSFTCPACGEDVVANPSLTRKCPMCGKDIKIKAVFCKYCQKDIPPVRPRNKTMEYSQKWFSSNTISSVFFQNAGSTTLSITERICGKKAAAIGQFSINEMLLVIAFSFLMPFFGLFHLVGFMILAVTNENHKHDIFLFQFGLWIIVSIFSWMFWIEVF